MKYTHTMTSADAAVPHFFWSVSAVPGSALGVFPRALLTRLFLQAQGTCFLSEAGGGILTFPRHSRRLPSVQRSP